MPLPLFTQRAKLLLFSLSVLLLLILTTALTINTSPSRTPHSHLHTTTTTTDVADPTTIATATTHCSSTLYPSLCISTLTTIPDLQTKPLPDIICSTINRTTDSVRSTSSNCSSYLHKHNYNLTPLDRLAIADCLDLFDTTLDQLQAAVSALSPKSSSPCNVHVDVDDVMTMLSASMTNQYTCLDGFSYETNGGMVRPHIESRLYHISHLMSNSLAMTKKLTGGPGIKTQSKRPFFGYGQMVKASRLPRWMKAGDRKLLQAPVANVTMKADVIVAKDGSGNFTTVASAVAAAPNTSSSGNVTSAKRFVIHIKAGAYFENVEVGKNKVNLMFVGDGIGKTVIKANRNVVDGWTTFRSATVAVVGDGFLARDMTIENGSGASKHQAVALRVGADLAAFYRCSFVGYQDTLYVHSLRQFYRECDIYGTVDFIFGNAAVVFQNCNLYARRPDPNQSNIFTAQGRTDPNQNTGISIQKCKVTAASDLIPVQSNFSTYLGRPWKEYSRTVYLQSYLDSLINPAGWLEWNGTFGLDTLYYGEYMNQGPGSNTSARVKWPGYHVITSAADAMNFTVGPFIQGGQWLGATSFPFSVGLN